MANILLITADDLATSFEDKLDPEKIDFYQYKLDAAVRLMIANVPTIPARIESGALDAQIVKDLVLVAVGRIARAQVNGGYQSESIAGASYTNFSLDTSSNNFFTPSDYKLVSPPAIKGRVRTSRVRPGRGWGI